MSSVSNLKEDQIINDIQSDDGSMVDNDNVTRSKHLVYLLKNKLNKSNQKGFANDPKERKKQSAKKSGNAKTDPEVQELIGKLNETWGLQRNTLEDF